MIWETHHITSIQLVGTIYCKDFFFAFESSYPTARKSLSSNRRYLPPFACRRAFCGSSILLIPSKIVCLWERDSEEHGARRGRRCKEQLGVLGAPARLCFINPASVLLKDWASRAPLPSLIFIAAGIEAMCGKMCVDVEFVPQCGVKRTSKSLG
jgi:hypothetical protein